MDPEQGQLTPRDRAFLSTVISVVFIVVLGAAIITAIVAGATVAMAWLCPC